MRLIDVDDLYYKIVRDEYGEERFAVYEYEIDNAPTIEAEPILKAEWVKKGWNNYVCSHCTTQYVGFATGSWKYCPKCGAKTR